MRKAVFIDRDGTLIDERHFIGNPDDVRFIAGSEQALRTLHNLGYALVVVSNQSGVARGLLSISDVEAVNQRIMEILSSQGIEIDGIYYCPHYAGGSVAEYSIECDCRKPSPGMLLKAATELGLEIESSFVIGDKVSDVELGFNSGSTAILVLSGYGKKSVEKLKRKPAYIAENLLDAAMWIASLKATLQ